MKQYIYRNTKTNEVLFDIFVEDDMLLTEVDTLFEKATGINPVKTMWIGVRNAAWCKGELENE